ncbi:hypothetical protein D3C78_1172470 [compost metagenome]
MLVVIGADIRVGYRHLVLHSSGVHWDVAYFDLFWRNKAVLVLAVVVFQLVVGHGLLGLQRFQIQRSQAHIALLQHQCRHVLSFGRQNKARTAKGLDHLLVNQLLTH